MCVVGHWPSWNTERAQEILSNVKVRGNVHVCKLHYKFLKVLSFSAGSSDLNSNLDFKDVNTFLEIGLNVSVIQLYFLLVGCGPLPVETISSLGHSLLLWIHIDPCVRDSEFMGTGPSIFFSLIEHLSGRRREMLSQLSVSQCLGWDNLLRPGSIAII